MTTTDSVKHISHQIQSILNRLSDNQYSLELDIFNGSSIGKHIRHIFDFYYCIVNQGDSITIDYNCRSRNPLIENNRSTAISAFTQILNLAEGMRDEKELSVITDFSIDENEERPVVSSSVGRELMYAYDHAVHHLAIIKMGIGVAFPEISLDNHIGIAPSTIKYQSKN